MAKLTPEQFAEKHARNLKASTADMERGVQAVTVSPTAKAADAAAKMRANLIKAIDSGKWARRLKTVSLDEWKSKMITKGIPRVSAGIDEAHDKVVEFASELLPHIDTAKAKIAGMPDVTLDDSINRMTTFIREMAKFERKL